MSALTFCHRHRVTYAECTVGNHIYHSRYLDILEAARGEFCRSLGVPLARLQEEGTAFPVTECRLSYKHPARYDDVLSVTLWLTGLARVRLWFGYRVTDQTDRPILEAATIHACTTLDEKPCRLPDDLKKLLLPYLHDTKEST